MTSDKKKLTVNLSAEIVDDLRQLADDNRTSLTEELRRAIADRKFFTERRKKGDSIILENEKEPNIKTIVRFD